MKSEKCPHRELVNGGVLYVVMDYGTCWLLHSVLQTL